MLRGRMAIFIEVYLTDSQLPPHPIPTGAQKNRLRPFGEENIHWTFSCFRLISPRKRGEGWSVGVGW